MSVPLEIRTHRLLLRPWRGDDAALLHPILETNWEHLGPWIPERVARSAPVPILTQRLDGFADDFATGRAWRYGIFAADDARLLGEVSLFARTESGRVPYCDADRAEVGYWLRNDATGHGFATEATRAMLDVAAALPRFSRVEIRCDARNASSAAVPQRLGFVHETTIADSTPGFAATNTELQIWSLALSKS